MNNKVLVSIEIPEIGYSYDVFIPINEQIWKITKLVSKCVSDLSGATLLTKETYYFINKNNGIIYPSNDIVADTDIRNGTELVLVKQ
ncbi:MAG: hypothetical protein II625_02545 [Bacilli bacterium]|nr:hypothetical protein [Bacilli bacterium]